MEYKIDWKTFDVTIEEDKYIVVVDSKDQPVGFSKYSKGDEIVKEELFKRGNRWEYWDNIINGNFVPSHQFNCSVEIPSDIIVETDSEKQKNILLKKPKITGILMGQFGKEDPFPMFDVIDNKFDLIMLQTEETNELYRNEFERDKKISHRALHIKKGDTSFGMFIKPSEKSVQELNSEI